MNTADAAQKWPKKFPPLTDEQQRISDDFMHHWHTVLPAKYGVVDRFNHQYPVLNAPANFVRTLEIGAGNGEHLKYEQLSPQQEANYVAVDLRDNMAAEIRQHFPRVKTVVADCQQHLPFDDGHFDRVLAIHVLEHLPDLPCAIAELYRLIDKRSGTLSVVIPCEGSWAYTVARRISAQRVFEQRYKQPYRWLIEREHINLPDEIRSELSRSFVEVSASYFPLYIAATQLNLCIGLTLRPRTESASLEAGARTRWIERTGGRVLALWKRQIVRFGVVGGVSAVAGVSVLTACHDLLDLDYRAATSAGYGASVLVHYLLNRSLTFTAAAHSTHAQSLWRYGFMLGINYGLTLSAVTVAVEWMNWHPALGMLCSTALSAVFNFLAMRHFVFARR